YNFQLFRATLIIFGTSYFRHNFRTKDFSTDKTNNILLQFMIVVAKNAVPPEGVGALFIYLYDFWYPIIVVIWGICDFSCTFFGNNKLYYKTTYFRIKNV